MRCRISEKKNLADVAVRLRHVAAIVLPCRGVRGAGPEARRDEEHEFLHSDNLQLAGQGRC